MAASCKPSNIDRVDQVIREELHKLLKDGVAEDELAEARRSYLEQEKTHRGMDSVLAAILVGQLYNKRTFAHAARLEDQIKALTPAAVNAALRRHIDPKRLVIVRAGDFKKTAPKASPRR